MRTYNKNKALELYNDFKQLTKVDVFNNSRETKIMTLRSLFYKVLKDNNFMNDREIAEFFTEMGKKINRSSIYASLTKIEHYYLNFDFFKDIYDLYFYDLKEKYDLQEQLKKHKLNKVKHHRRFKLSKQRDKLDRLIDTVECEDRRDELYEMINLRIKSWEWKSKDNCQVIEGYSPLQGTF